MAGEKHVATRIQPILEIFSTLARSRESPLPSRFAGYRNTARRCGSTSRSTGASPANRSNHAAGAGTRINSASTGPHAFDRMSGAVQEYPDDAVVVPSERDVDPLGQVEQRLAGIITRRLDRVQQDPAAHDAFRNTPIHRREVEFPRGLDELSVVHPTERAPVRPPHVEGVRNQYRNDEHGDETDQHGTVPPLRRALAQFSFAGHHGP